MEERSRKLYGHVTVEICALTAQAPFTVCYTHGEHVSHSASSCDRIQPCCVPQAAAGLRLSR